MEDIIFCIIIIIIVIVTPSKDVFTLIRDVIDVSGHVKSWGKTSVVSRSVVPTNKLLKFIFESPKERRPWKQGEVRTLGLLGVLGD